jgi:pSer/pThr/pTyr-binding forkhead associated (FHA) protein
MPIRQVELVVRRPGHPERRLILGVGTINLGRGEDNEIVLPDIGVSRRHAQIKVEPKSVVVSDLSSGNGTFVGGQRIASHTVRDGDEVFIDPFVLAFHVKSEASVPPPAATSPSGAPTVHFNERDVATEGRLVVLQGQRLDASYPIGGPRLTMGRAENHDVVLFDPAASRQHAEIRANGNDYWVVDPGSANGTFVNGHRIRETRLKHGDRIRVGATEFRFELVPSAAAPAPERAPASPSRDAPEVTGRTEPLNMPVIERPRPIEPHGPIVPPPPPVVPPRPSPPPSIAPIELVAPPIEAVMPPPPPVVPPPAPALPPPVDPPSVVAAPAPVVESPAPVLPTPEVVASPVAGAFESAVPSAVDIPSSSPPPVKLDDASMVETLEIPPPPPPTPIAPRSPPQDSPSASRARMGDTIVPDELPEPVNDPMPWSSPRPSGAVRTEALVEESPDPTPPSPFGAEIAAVFSMAPPAVPSAPTPRVDIPTAHHSSPASPVSVSLDAPRPAPLKPTTPPTYPNESDPTVRGIPPKAKPISPPAPARPMPPPPPPARAPAPRASAAPSQPPKTPSMMGTFIAILLAMLFVLFVATVGAIGAGIAYYEGMFDQPATTAPAEVPAAPSSELAQLGMHLMKNPALPADAARAFYHAARLDPGDGSNARLAAVACEAAAIAELRYDIERRKLSDEEKKKVRDEALAMQGDEARQAALERAARLLPNDVEVRAALDAARAQRLEAIRQALARASERAPAGG